MGVRHMPRSSHVGVGSRASRLVAFARSGLAAMLALALFSGCSHDLSFLPQPDAGVRDTGTARLDASSGIDARRPDSGDPCSTATSCLDCLSRAECGVCSAAPGEGEDRCASRDRCTTSWERNVDPARCSSVWPVDVPVMDATVADTRPPSAIDCEAYARAYCTGAERCLGNFAAQLQDNATCQRVVQQRCARITALPDTGTLEDPSGCFAALAGSSCDAFAANMDFLRVYGGFIGGGRVGPGPTQCRMTPGTRRLGARCSSQAQCGADPGAGRLLCVVSRFTIVNNCNDPGICVPALPAGPVGAGATCMLSPCDFLAGLECQGTPPMERCVAPTAGVGESCTADSCALGLGCVSGRCVALGARVGAPCSTAAPCRLDLGLFCSTAGGTSTCQPTPAMALPIGSACRVDGPPCVSIATCVANSCRELGREGEACPCAVGLACNGGRCVAPRELAPCRCEASACTLFRLRCAASGVDCEACPRNCAGRTCGADGCGGTCGTCASNQTCTASGTCCTPSCPIPCRADGCGGVCGGCPAGQSCSAAGTCCARNCAGRMCGSDGCGGSCGTCSAGRACNASGQCACVPNCSGRNCGPDGCGGTCGTCSAPLFSCNSSGRCIQTMCYRFTGGPCSRDSDCCEDACCIGGRYANRCQCARL